MSEGMSVELIEKIQEMTDIPDKVVEIDGRKYTERNFKAIKEPLPGIMEVSTLTSLVDYIAANKDNLDLESLIVHVDSPTSVRIRSNLFGEFKQREEYVRASPYLPDYDHFYGRKYAKEEFIPCLQSMFMENANRELLLTTLAHVRLEGGADLEDDGITQKVTVHTGAVRVDQKELPNPLKLIPFSTFPDVEQPERMFTFRLYPDGSCRLIEADGGAWRAIAARTVKEFLEKELETHEIKVTIIA
ncbi:hypothetical protein D0S45_17545 [Marinifilum sp. JC120]|nr:hypothetical protein D0S45_17545 [Marinifilum sp. JC120]